MVKKIGDKRSVDKVSDSIISVLRGLAVENLLPMFYLYLPTFPSNFDSFSFMLKTYHIVESASICLIVKSATFWFSLKRDICFNAQNLPLYASFSNLLNSTLFPNLLQSASFSTLPHSGLV